MAVVVLAGGLIGDSLGWRISLSDGRGEGRALLLLIGATLAVRFITLGGNTLASYGLTTPRHWQVDILVAALIGGAITSMVYVSGFASGELEPGDGRTFSGTTSAVVTAVTGGFLVAYVQETVYRGYIATELRARIGSASLVVTALVFALTQDLTLERWATPEVALSEVVVVFLFGLVLGCARAYHGNLIVPIGIVGGVLSVDVYMRRGKLFAGYEGTSALDLLADGALHSIPGLAVILLIIAIYLWALSRRPPGRTEWSAPASRARGAVARSLGKGFDRFNPFTNLSAIAPTDLLARRLIEARLMIPPIYWPRLWVTLVVSILTTVLNLPERLLAPLLVSRVRVPDPVIIVGMHRSGTSLVHELLSLDDQFVAPRNFQVFNPYGFLLFGRLIDLIGGVLLPWRRPMDEVEMTVMSAAEDEFALAYGVGLSPYWSITFPRQAKRYDRLIYASRMSSHERARWKAAWRTFLRKVCLFTRARPLLKSPYHAARVDLINEVFAGARYIHIHRNPFDVYRSSQRLDARTHSLFQLQGRPRRGGYVDRLLDEHYLAVENLFEEAAAALPEGRVARTSYETLIDEPEAEIERIYRVLGLDFSEATRARLRNELGLRAAYRPNVHARLAPQERKRVVSALKPLFERWGYSTE